MIRVTAADGRRLEGRVEIGPQERLLLFFPQQDWEEGDYAIEVDARLEDPAGNNLRQVFDVDVTAASSAGVSRDAVELGFSVVASGRRAAGP